MLKIKVILGSTREGRFGEQPAKWITEKAKAKPGLDVELLDLRDYPLPFFNAAATPSSKKEPYADPAVQKWTAKIAESDAFIIVTPEYNHGTSAVLKNAIDWVGPEWNRKVVGFVAYGTVGGARAVEQLRQVFPEVHAGDRACCGNDRNPVAASQKRRWHDRSFFGKCHRGSNARPAHLVG